MTRESNRLRLLKRTLIGVGVAIVCIGLLLAGIFFYAVHGVWSGMHRPAPKKEQMLSDIDDDQFRKVFAAARLYKAQDLGAVDSLIVSTWCGISTDVLQSLFERKALTPIDRIYFDSFWPTGQSTFDIYGGGELRGSGELMVGAMRGSDCVALMIIEM